MTSKKGKTKTDKMAATNLMTKNRLKETAPVWPLAFILLVVPLVVYAKVIPVIDEYLITAEGSVDLNVFAYYKGFWFLIATVAAVLIVTGKRLKGEISLSKNHFIYPVAVYALMTILSTVFSEYTSVSLSGYPNKSEGMWMLLGYCAVFFSCIHLVKTRRQYNLLLGSLWISGMIMTVIGILQATGNDPFMQEWVRRLIVPAQYQQFVTDMTLPGGTRQAYLTMGNSNFAGGYMSMIVSVFLALMLTTNNKRLQMVLLASNVLMAGTLMLTGSRAGYVGMLGSIIFTLVILWKRIRKKRTLLVSIIMVILVTNVIFGLLAHRSFYQGIETIIHDMTKKQDMYPTDLKDLNFSEKRMAFIGTEETLVIGMNDQGNPDYYDGDGGKLEWQVNEEAINDTEKHQITTPSHSHYSVSWETHDMGKRVLIDNGKVEGQFFYYQDEFLLIGRQGELLPYEPVESMGFEGREHIGTNRGYIWSRTLPLVKDTLLIGHGPDTFVYYFPQFDYLAMLQDKTPAGRMFDKPHNYYLQTAIHTGVISLLALLTLFGMYLYKGFKQYYKGDPAHWQTQYGISIMAGCIAYLTAGLFNDSVIGTTTVFWVLLGMGVATLIGERTKKSME